LGTIAATSFYPAKNLGAAGDGGAVTTDDPQLARAVRLLGAHGSETKYVHESVGFNSRLDAAQAIVLSAKLWRLRAWNERRRAVAARYRELLDGVEGIELPPEADGEEHVWHLYVVQLDERQRVHDELEAADVQSAIHYPVPLHRSAALEGRVRVVGGCTVAERAAGRILSLPMFPHLDDESVVRVATAVRAALRQPERSPAWV
jgi:dTDP-4-amino-4,6-dideoxygalactose transaminase